MDTFSHLVPWVISCWILYCSAQPLIIQPTFFYSIVHLNGHPQNILVTLPHLGTCLREPVSFERNPSTLQDSNTTSSGESNISFFISALYSNQSQSSFHPHTTNRAAMCSKSWCCTTPACLKFSGHSKITSSNCWVARGLHDPP